MRPLIALALVLLPTSLGQAPPRIDYTLTPVPAAADQPARTDVQMRLSRLDGSETVRLQMPTWSPGDYHVQNHAKYVTSLRASDAAGRALQVTHPDQNTWDVTPQGSSEIVVRYSLPNTPGGIFSPNVQVRTGYAFYNGPAVYLYLVGHKQDPATVHVTLPEGWKGVIVPLERLPDDAAHPRVAGFSAPDYDTLADSPVLAGDCATQPFTVGGRTHTVAFFDARQGVQTGGLTEPLPRVVAAEQRIMGGAPYPRYVFYFDIGAEPAGLEHLNACRIGVLRRTTPGDLAEFAAHEFFHLWNVKRLRPAVLGPFDYIKPPRTRNLWFCEGVTQYYAELAMRRAGLWSDDDLLAALGRSISQLQTTPARLRVTADEASMRVWESGTSEGYGGLSYYLKGEVIGLCLDLKLRAASGGRASLDTLMRAMMERYGLPKPGYGADGIRDEAIRLGGAEMGPFYDLLCRSTRELPLSECLGYAGLVLSRQGGWYHIDADPSADAGQRALRAAWLAGQ